MPEFRTGPKKPKARATTQPKATLKAARKPVAKKATSSDGGTHNKHERAAARLRELRDGAEALSANADRLLLRFAS